MQLDPTPDRDALLSLAWSAADMLARAAVTSDQLPASQSVFLCWLIQMRSKVPRATVARVNQASGAGPHLETQTKARPFDFGDIDFKAFGMSVAADDTMRMWPPVEFPSRVGSPRAARLVVHQEHRAPADADPGGVKGSSVHSAGETPI